MSKWVNRVLGLVSMLLIGSTQADPVSYGSMQLDIYNHTVKMELQWPLASLQQAAPEIILPHGVQTPLQGIQLAHLKRYLHQHIQLVNHGNLLNMEVLALHLTAQQLQATLLFSNQVATLSSLTIHNDGISHHVPDHYTNLYIHSDWRNGQITPNPVAIAQFDQTQPTYLLARPSGSLLTGLQALLWQGVLYLTKHLHYWLLLGCLLLPVPLIYRGGRWRANASLADSCRRLVHLLLVLIMAHAIMLLASIWQSLHIPPVWIKSGLEITVIIAALHMWRPRLAAMPLLVAAVLGSGLGLACTQQAPMVGLTPTSKALSLIVINMGAELALLLVLFSCLPWLWLTRRHVSYRGVCIVLAGVSALCAICDLAATLGYSWPLWGQWRALMMEYLWWTYLGLVAVAMGAQIRLFQIRRQAVD